LRGQAIAARAIAALHIRELLAAADRGEIIVESTAGAKVLQRLGESAAALEGAAGLADESSP